MLAYKFLLEHRLKMWKRSLTIVGKINFAISLITILFGTFLTWVIVKLLNLFISTQLPEQTNIEIFKKLLVYYFFFELLSRFFIQNISRINIKYYITLNFKKSNLSWFVFLDSFLNISNLFTVIFMLLYLLPVVYHPHVTSDRLLFLMSFLISIIVVNCLVSIVKYLTWYSPIIYLFFPVLLIGIIYVLTSLDQVYTVSNKIEWLLFNWHGLILNIFMALFFSLVELWIIKKTFYMDIAQSSRAAIFLERKKMYNSLILNWINFELKLIFRSGRTKKILYGSFLYQVVSIYFISNNVPGYEIYYLVLFTLTGVNMLSLSYGQYNYAWHSDHFKLLFLSPIDLKHILKAKFILLSGLNGVFYLPILIIYWDNEHLVLKTFSCLIYSMGIVPLSCLLAGLINTKPIDISARGFFANWQGTGRAPILAGVPVFFIPLFFVFFFSALGIPLVTFYVMAILGIVIMLSKNLWIGLISNALAKRKHKLIEAFSK